MRIEIQGGETLDTVNEQVLGKILEGLHPEGRSRVTAYASDAEWLSVLGCISEGFTLSYKSPHKAGYQYCRNVLGFVEARAVLAAFVRGDADWKERLLLVQRRPSTDILIGTIVIIALASIVVLFLNDMFQWFNNR